jgi:hypothetical protein
MLKTLSIKIKGTIPAKASPKADASTDLYCKGDICYMNASKKSQNPSGIIAVDKETLFESCSDGSNKDDELCGELKKSGFEFINGSK